jgi:TonB family protein
MKKVAMICSCVLAVLVCGFARENRGAGQGKAMTQRKKAPAAAAPLPQVDKEKIRAHVKYLSSDELEGRGTGQRGGDMAADYIGKQFASYGLKPAGDNGTFFEEVPMVGVKTLPETTFKFVEASGKSFEAKNLTEFVTNNESQAETADIDAPIVFVGYGIKAPEYDWDDYKTVDLHGKVALLFVNEPSSDDPDFFKGKAMTYYGRWTYKFEETARRGAVATLIIHRTDLASYGWDVVRNSWGTERSYLKRDETPKLQAASWIQLDVAKRIVGLVGLDLDRMFQRAQMKDFKPLQLPVHLKAHVASQLKPFGSRNVLAMLQGTDAVLGKEAVLYTAHYDHLGIDPSLPGDKIYNGADDNATGCGILLELARVWAAMPVAAPRSILFASVTAEEQGLLGSEYLGKHSPVPPGKIMLDLNFDDVPPLGTPEEVEVSGAERTTFYPVVQATARDFRLAIRPDPRPEAGHYYRSDHFSLARVGVPSFSINEGIKYAGHSAEWGIEQAKDFTEHRYHQPSDEYSPDRDFTGDAVIARFGFVLGSKAAWLPTLAGWVPGDEFEPARKKSQASSPIGSHLFDGLPSLHLVACEPLQYPPLARQTRISGVVKLHVVVDKTGAVAELSILSGHPLLREAVERSVRSWKFELIPAGPVDFDLAYEFALRDKASDHADEETTFDIPGRVRLVSNPLIHPNYAQTTGRRGE